MKHFEVNFDGLVGPTHNYAGLSYGNVASQSNAHAISNPQEAAKQGLLKMKALTELGMTQGVLAPQERPDLATLRRLGFTGSDGRVLEQAAKQAPAVLAACYSASSMWTANAATVSPSADTQDGRIHFTPANLTNKFHRSLEPDMTGRILRAVFNNERYFSHHRHLPDNDHFGDEGAANHTRLCRAYGEAGVELFVYGRSAFDHARPAPQRYPARQTLEASQAIARLHGLDDENVVFIQQNPAVIDQGVFHNDVIAVGNQNVLLFHQQAFLNTAEVLADIRHKFGEGELHFIEVPTAEVSVRDAVTSYLFNTQILTLPNGDMALIAPTECRDNPTIAHYLETRLRNDTPISQVHYLDVKQSMRNGGGPACLRLRVAMNDEELAAVNPACLINDRQLTRLDQWITRHYRDRLSLDDLRDPALVEESRCALDELTQILKLGAIYPFQR
ncbi:N-succinylarginine dihydrolase [Aeromonas cavernicola]|uniref:N-succinylarginine dihydrolase n=1 Tax=Aeromonas cavernicola TaxID=1006623 RepID=A0A2H9U364_9GAMM|nr:N-succinylarginine dihydrolase [Aeromonas cavernicola]PJG58460.1 N-succinylarginine dihydrolase [Aeromonas cavernicola]